MELHQRLAEFFRRLQAAPSAGSAEEALALVCRLIEEVEDELCPLPREDPPPFRFTGRMYAPMPDRIRRTQDSGFVANTLRHRVHCHPDGGITIVHVPKGLIELVKEGRKA
jgi:hypothetical protein